MAFLLRSRYFVAVVILRGEELKPQLEGGGRAAFRPRDTMLQISLGNDTGVVLYADRLRDGRVALGTRTRRPDGSWENGELHLLSAAAYLALAAWLSAAVEDDWAQTLRERQADQVRTAFDLYGEGPGAVEKLAHDTLHEISPGLLRRAMMLLINSIGPEARERLVARINETEDSSEESALRRQLGDERDALAYAVAAGALFDALDRGVLTESPPLSGS